jgi:tRNA (cytidine/uridine-2'-O-)-methyltransferase
MRLALYEPDIPPNTGTLIRLCACLGVALDIIEPCGFPLSDRVLKRAAMDYGEGTAITLHRSFADFQAGLDGRRLVLLTTKTESSYLDFAYRPEDILLLGRESAGVPDAVHEGAGARIRIPMAAGRRSLNVAVAGAIVLAEAMRQTGGFASLR